MATQLLIETMVASVGKSNPTLDLQTDTIFAGDDMSKIKKSLAI